MQYSYVVMADVIGSRLKNSNTLISEFKFAVNKVNSELRTEILSPYTITLGDEFQGVARSLFASTKTVIMLEELRLRGQMESELRYVVNYGQIDTPINKDIAYEMLGEGLTKAREMLTEKRRGQSRFIFSIPGTRLGLQLQKLLEVMMALAQRWTKPDDTELIFDMIENQNNQEVAEKYGKDRSQIRKRRKFLLVDEYRATREVVLELASEWK